MGGKDELVKIHSFNFGIWSRKTLEKLRKEVVLVWFIYNLTCFALALSKDGLQLKLLVVLSSKIQEEGRNTKIKIIDNKTMVIWSQFVNLGVFGHWWRLV